MLSQTVNEGERGRKSKREGLCAAAVTPLCGTESARGRPRPRLTPGSLRVSFSLCVYVCAGGSIGIWVAGFGSSYIVRKVYAR